MRPGRRSVRPDRSTSQWAVSLAFAGPSQGTVILGFEAGGAQTLAKLIMALEERSPRDRRRGHAARNLRPGAERGRTAGRIRRPPAGRSQAGRHSAHDGADDLRAPRRRSILDVDCELGVPRAGERRAACGGPGGAAAAFATAAPANLDLILDIDLPLTVRFGETEMSLHSLTRLAPGSIIDLGRSPDDPVDILVNGRLVARGEVVVVSGNYGVRIVEVNSAADRLKTVAA